MTPIQQLVVHSLIVAAGAVVAWWLGERVVLWVLRAARRSQRRPHTWDVTPDGADWGLSFPLSHRAGDDGMPDVASSTSEEPLRGGSWIGRLERLAVYSAILAGYPEAIAFVLAVKGLGRYPELRSSKVSSEAFILGTLASILAAVGVAGVVHALVGLL